MFDPILMTTLTLQVTEVLFDFDDGDFTPEEQQLVTDSVVGNVFEVEVFDPNNDDELADAIVEEVTDFAEWTVVSLSFQKSNNTNTSGSTDTLVPVVALAQ